MESKQIGKYKVIRELGRGTFSEVYLVEDDQGQQHALKIIRPIFSDKHAKMLERESSMRVHQVQEQMAIEANHVYVLSPNRHIAITDQHLDVDDSGPERLSVIIFVMYWQEYPGLITRFGA